MKTRQCASLAFVALPLIFFTVYFIYHQRVFIDGISSLFPNVDIYLSSSAVVDSKYIYQNASQNRLSETRDEPFSIWRPSSSHHDLVAVPSHGRFGNQLFQYASLLGIAHSNGKRPLMTGSSLLKGIFNMSYLEDVETKSWPAVHEEKYAVYDPKFETLPKGNVTILQYFQSWRYFQSVQDMVRKEFKLTKEYYEKGLTAFKKHTVFWKNRTTIALHVRRGDMTQGWFKNEGFTAAPLSYVRKAVSHMKDKYHNPVFLIATDDKKWCNTYLSSDDNVILRNDNAYMDFVTMTFCDHMIMTVGTFGWWAAYLIGGHTVYYNGFPLPGTRLSRELEKKDYFMPNWIAIGA